MKILRENSIQVSNISNLIVGDKYAFSLTDKRNVVCVCVKSNVNSKVFILDTCLALGYMGKQYYEVVDWESSYLRKQMNDKNGDIFKLFPKTMSDYFIPFDNGDILSIPSATEIYGAEVVKNYYDITEKGQSQFLPCVEIGNKVCLAPPGEAGNWCLTEWYWLRTPLLKEIDGVVTRHFACTNHSGSPSGNLPSNIIGIRPIFLLSNDFEGV